MTHGSRFVRLTAIATSQESGALIAVYIWFPEALINIEWLEKLPAQVTCRLSACDAETEYRDLLKPSLHAVCWKMKEN